MISTVPLKFSAHLGRSVREVMHSGYVALPADAPLDVVARTMCDADVHAVLVSDVHGPMGWVTSRGLLHNHPMDWTQARAGDAVTELPAAVGSDQTVEDAMNAFLASGASHILVQDDGHTMPGHPVTVGVIAESDLVRFVAGRS